MCDKYFSFWATDDGTTVVAKAVFRDNDGVDTKVERSALHSDSCKVISELYRQLVRDLTLQGVYIENKAGGNNNG